MLALKPIVPQNTVPPAKVRGVLKVVLLKVHADGIEGSGRELSGSGRVGAPVIAAGETLLDFATPPTTEITLLLMLPEPDCFNAVALLEFTCMPQLGTLTAPEPLTEKDSLVAGSRA